MLKGWDLFIFTIEIQDKPPERNYEFKSNVWFIGVTIGYDNI